MRIDSMYRRRLTLMAVFAVGAAACAGPIATAGGGDLRGTTTTSTSLPVTTTLGPKTTSTTRAPTPQEGEQRPALAWMTPAGIPVSILETEGRLHTVLTPCGNEAPLVLGTPLYQTTVVIDPGHGGPIDTGAWGPYGLREGELNLEVAQAVEILLGQRGIPAMLTRTGDYPTRLFVRSALADALQAELMVSIHHNSPSAFRSSEPGTEVFIQKDSQDSARLGGAVVATHEAGLLDR